MRFGCGQNLKAKSRRELSRVEAWSRAAAPPLLPERKLLGLLPSGGFSNDISMAKDPDLCGFVFVYSGLGTPWDPPGGAERSSSMC